MIMLIYQRVFVAKFPAISSLEPPPCHLNMIVIIAATPSSSHTWHCPKKKQTNARFLVIADIYIYYTFLRTFRNRRSLGQSWLQKNEMFTDQWLHIVPNGPHSPKFPVSKYEPWPYRFRYIYIYYPWRIHGAGIYANIWGIFDGIHVTIYSSTMDPMGYREYWLLMIIVYCHCCRVIIATFLVFAWVILLLWLLDIQCRSMQYISHHLMGSWWTARLMTCLCCQISIGWRQDCWIWDGSVQKLAICCNIHCNTLW